MPYSWLPFTVGCQGVLSRGKPSRLIVFSVDSEKIVLVRDVSIFFPIFIFLEQFLFQNSRMMIYKVNF